MGRVGGGKEVGGGGGRSSEEQRLPVYLNHSTKRKAGMATMGCGSDEMTAKAYRGEQ